jgi:Leucine-rich repeat (LRR) protein
MQLRSEDARFVDRLALSIGWPRERVLSRLLGGSESAVTRIEGGRFTVLHLSGFSDVLDSAAVLEVGTLPGLRVLDCAGLGLERLEIESLPRLRHLHCARNSLVELELVGCPALESLDADGNALMLLDLRTCEVLEALRCSGNRLAALVLPPGTGELRVLDCSRNQLVVLDLGDQPELVELVCFRNSLRRLDVESAPALRVLDCARNDLRNLLLPTTASLQQLDVCRNVLEKLDLSGASSLEVVLAEDNYLAELDLRAQAALREVRCSNNQLQWLRFGRTPALLHLSCTNNRLAELEIPDGESLLSVACDRNEIATLAMPESRALSVISCTNNRLKTLGLERWPALAHLACEGNRLETVDLRGCQQMCSLTVSAQDGSGPRVLATDVVRATLEAYHRVRAAGPREISGLDAAALHARARTLVGRAADEELLAIVRHPLCDRGTALLVYWTRAPHYYLRYTSEEGVRPFELPGWQLMRALEERVGQDDFAGREIWFDPRNDKQTTVPTGMDWTRDLSETTAQPKRAIPPALFVPNGGAEGADGTADRVQGA